MSIEQQIADALVEKTNNGTLQWESNDGRPTIWTCRYNGCTFTVDSNGGHVSMRTSHSVVPAIRIVEGEAVTPLIRTLNVFRRPQLLNLDQALRKALNCLTGQ